MTGFEKLALACTFLVAATAIWVSIYTWGQMTMLRDRIDTIDDEATPSFADEHAEPELKPKKSAANTGVELRQFTDKEGRPHTFQFVEGA